MELQRAGPTQLGRRAYVAVLCLAIAVALGAFLLTARRSVPGGALPARATLSLLAVGDTGSPAGFFPAFDRQRAVASGLVREDRRARVDALVLLGDNFYEKGLRQRELESRVLENVVDPYCHFVDLAGPLSGTLSTSCAPDRSARAASPIYAVLGNHDVRSVESRTLQADAIPRFVSNWSLTLEPARSVELGGGVSLILFDSNLLQAGGDATPLRDALRGSRGPWRVLAAHHPVGTRHGDQGHELARTEGYAHRIQNAIEDAGVEVQLMLAGHEHNLQLVALDDPGPRLIVVSGAGSRPRPIESSSRGRLFGFDGLGFARIDLVGGPEAERLEISLFSTPRWLSVLGLAPELLVRWAVTLDGRLVREPTSVRVLEPS